MYSKNKKSESPITVRAINMDTNKVMFESTDGDDVIKKAENSGENYILDFETDPGYNFIF